MVCDMSKRQELPFPPKIDSSQLPAIELESTRFLFPWIPSDHVGKWRHHCRRFYFPHDHRESWKCLRIPSLHLMARQDPVPGGRLYFRVSDNELSALWCLESIPEIHKDLSDTFASFEMIGEPAHYEPRICASDAPHFSQTTTVFSITSCGCPGIFDGMIWLKRSALIV